MGLRTRSGWCHATHATAWPNVQQQHRLGQAGQEQQHQYYQQPRTFRGQLLRSRVGHYMASTHTDMTDNTKICSQYVDMSIFVLLFSRSPSILCLELKQIFYSRVVNFWKVEKDKFLKTNVISKAIMYHKIFFLIW